MRSATHSVPATSCRSSRAYDADFQKDYTYAGRFKIGQKQLCNVLLPF